MNKEEIKEFVEFRTDEDGTYFYYNDKDNVEQWSYKLDDLKDYIINLQQENTQLKEIENKLNFIKNRVKQGMSQENINKCAIQLVNSYLKEN